MMQSNECHLTDTISQYLDMKSREQLESEISELKEKIQQTEQSLQNIQERNRLQTTQTNQLFLSMKNRIKNQKETIRYLSEERDILVKNFLSSLLYLESGLRREQKEIQKSLDEKDRIIEQLQCELKILKSSRCKVNQEKKLFQTKPELIDTVSDDTHDSGIEMQILESSSQNQLCVRNEDNFHDFNLEPEIKDRRHLCGSYERLTELGIKTAMGCYNRLFSNHRSVTKPRDVKQKRFLRRGCDKPKTI